MYAQPDTLWTNTIGGGQEDQGYKVICVDNDYVIVGYTRSAGAGGSDAYLIKANSAGDTSWTKTFGGTYDDVANSIVQTSDNGFVFTGSYGTSTNFDLWIVKVDSAGNLDWEKIYDFVGNDNGRSIKQLSDGGYIVCGEAKFTGLNAFAMIVRLDSSGDTLWYHLHDFGGDDELYDVIPTNSGGYLFTGRTTSYGAGNYDLWLVKTNSLGDTSWTKTFGGSQVDFGRSILLTSEQDIVIAGYTNSFGSYYQGWIIKTDSLGNELWNKLHGSAEFDYFASIKSTYDDGYILTGWTTVSYVGTMWLVKTNSIGDTLWTKNWGGGSEDRGYSVDVINDSTYILAGYTESFGAGNGDVWLVKVLDAESGAPSIEVTPDTLEYYVVDTTVNAVDTMWVKNIGTALLEVDSIISTESWIISITPDDFDVSPGDSQAVEVVVNASGLPNNIYYDNLSIYSNDALNPVYQEPVKLTVDVEGIYEDPDKNLSHKIMSYTISPNPARSNMTIQFNLLEKSMVSLKIYNVSGQLINTLLQEAMDKGEYKLTWNVKDKTGKKICSGVYFLQIDISGKKLSRKVLIF